MMLKNPKITKTTINQKNTELSLTMITTRQSKKEKHENILPVTNLLPHDEWDLKSRTNPYNCSKTLPMFLLPVVVQTMTKIWIPYRFSENHMEMRTRNRMAMNVLKLILAHHQILWTSWVVVVSSMEIHNDLIVGKRRGMGIVIHPWRNEKWVCVPKKGWDCHQRR